MASRLARPTERHGVRDAKSNRQYLIVTSSILSRYIKVLPIIPLKIVRRRDANRTVSRDSPAPDSDSWQYPLDSDHPVVQSVSPVFREYRRCPHSTEQTVSDQETLQRRHAFDKVDD